MAKVDATVTVEGVPVAALRHVQRAMLVAGHNALSEVYKGDVLALMPVRCEMCAFKNSATFCGNCSALSITSDTDWFEAKAVIEDEG